MSAAERTADSVVTCSRCARDWAWLGDHGQSVALTGHCLWCKLLDYENDEVGGDEYVGRVMRAREAEESRLGRRVLPCVGHKEFGCPRCSGRGWIVGYPPGFGHLSLR